MRTKIKIEDKFYEIEVLEIKENLIKVKIDDEDYFFTQNNSQELIFIEKKDLPFLKKKEEKEILYILPREKEIKSPIAGVISRIYVKDGEEIGVGKTIATLIAMKMENEIISESAGKVKEIKVKENQFVNTGQVLITLE